MLVYHGSPYRFKLFDYNKMRTNGTTEGVGFYFTDNRRIAEAYAQGAYVYTASFNGKKSLSDTRLTIDRIKFREYLIALHDAHEFLSNWGEVDYEGLDAVLCRALDGEYNGSNNDVELISGVVNAYGGAEIPLTLCRDILGYDSIVTTAKWGDGANLYIALTHDAYTFTKIAHLTEGWEVDTL